MRVLAAQQTGSTPRTGGLKNMGQESLVDVAGAALLARCSERTVRKAIGAGLLTPQPESTTKYLFTTADVTAWGQSRGRIPTGRKAPQTWASNLPDDFAALIAEAVPKMSPTEVDKLKTLLTRLKLREVAPGDVASSL